MKVIFIALAMLILPAPVLAQETGMLVTQAGGDNRPSTLGDLHRTEARLDRKIENVQSDLGARIDALARRTDALGARIDTLTTAVWTLLGVIVAAFLAGLLGIIAVLIPVLIRREKESGHSVSLPPNAPAPASR